MVLKSLDDKRTYNKKLKKETTENEIKYKEYKALFEALRKKSKNFYYAKHLTDCEHYIKKTGDTIKQLTGKTKSISKVFSKK